MGTFRRLAPVVSIVVLLLLLIGPMPASAGSEQGASGPGCSMWYVVKPGDTLNTIAAKYGTTASYLASINGLANPNFIRSGWTLCVKAGPATSRLRLLVHHQAGRHAQQDRPMDRLERMATRQRQLHREPGQDLLRAEALDSLPLALH